MKVVIAIDSFKGCISSEQAGAAVKKGILKAHPDAEVIVKPVSDGGEGLTNALISNLGCEKVTVLVSDPLNRKINASYTCLKGRISHAVSTELSYRYTVRIAHWYYVHAAFVIQFSISLSVKLTCAVIFKEILGIGKQNS